MEAALAKAKEIAAKLAAGGSVAEATAAAPPQHAVASSSGADSELGKRRWDADVESAGYIKPGLGADKRQREMPDSIYGPGEGGGGGGGESAVYQLEMRVPNHMVGYIIGKGGENVSRMTQASGANMQIAKESEMRPGETTRSIMLKGRTQEVVDDLKRRVEEVIEGHSTNRGASGGAAGRTEGGTAGAKEFNYPFIMKAPVPNDKVGVIIGRAGATIKGIQDRTQTNIQIPQVPDADDPTVRTLSIGGHSKEAVDAAQMEIFVTLQTFAAQTPAAKTSNMMFMQVPDDKVGIIIGKSGATIKEIQNRNSVRIQIPTAADVGTYPPVRTVSIQGPPEGQSGAKYEIESLLAAAPPGGSSGSGMGMGMGGGGMRGGAGYGGNPYGGGGGYGMPPQQPYGAAGYGYHQPYGAGAGTGAGPAAAYGGGGATGTGASAGAAAAPMDPTAYYSDFWLYASYYGEPAARQYYQQWSPPEGSLPPPAPTATAPDGAAGVPVSNAPADGASNDSAKSSERAPAGSDGANGEESSATPAADTTATSAAAAAPDEGAASDAADEATASATDEAWEAYKKQYTEWWTAYGKDTGAPEDPAEAYAAQQQAAEAVSATTSEQ